MKRSSLLSRFVRFARFACCFRTSSIVERTDGRGAQLSSFVGSVGRGASRTGTTLRGGWRLVRLNNVTALRYRPRPRSSAGGPRAGIWTGRGRSSS